MSHEDEVQLLCNKALKILTKEKIRFRPMARRGIIDTKKGYILARTNLRTKLITIDIYTARKREPMKIARILRSLCHEVAHHQKKPYRQLYRGKWITRQHFPLFYKQVSKNIEKLKSHKELFIYFD